MSVTKPIHTFALARVIAHSDGGDIPYPFRIIETYETTDGLRTRLTDGMWSTEETARIAYALFIKKFAGVKTKIFFEDKS